MAGASALLLGVLAALWTPAPWQLHAFGAVVALASLLVLQGRWRLAVAMMAGLLLTQHAARRVLDAAYDCGERRLVIATIDSIPARLGAGWQYQARVEPAYPPRHAPLRVRVAQSGLPLPQAGERWQLLLQFDAPQDGGGGADVRRALLRDRLSANARVRASPLNQRLAGPGASIDGLRAHVAERIGARVADPSAAALLVALAVGVTGDVSAMQWRVFNATGITHLVAISGMHVTFFAMLCMALARLAWRRCGWLAACCRRERFASVVGVTLAFGYALLSGFSVPAQRTAVMLAAFLLARGFARMTSPSWSVAVALVAVLVFDPLAALSAGFWLSFCAVAVIILVEGGRLQRPGALRAAASVQWLVTIALLPVTLLLFGTFSAIGPLVNAAAIPLFTFLLVPPVLIATALYLVPLSPAPFLADRLVDLAAWGAAAAWPWLARAADLPGALWSAGGSWLWMCLAVPAAACVLLPLPPSLRSGACALLCSGFLLRASPPAAGSLQVTVFDAGASRAVLLRTAHHQLLAGLGESFGTAGRRFETRLLPELLRDGRKSVEILVERTDRDSMRALAMAHARLSLQRATAAQPGAAPELAACADRQWNWDGVRFSQRALPSGCWLWAEAGGRLLVLAPERIAAGQWPGLEGRVSLVVLPRRARDAGSVLRAPWARDALALASVGDSEWQSNSWRAVRNERSESPQVLWSTAASGTLRLSLDAQGVEGRSGSTWAAGIWSTPGTGAQCRRLP